MSVTHCLFLKFKPDSEVTREAKAKTFLDLLGLKENCVHPDTGKPYMLSIKGGIDNSVEEGGNKGMTHGFVMEFASQKDRNYYIHDDPHHLRLESQIRALMEDGVAVDFTPTIFYDWASPDTNGAKANGKK
ncbi:uncharacterized protein TRUGW13939_04800 [Talaromyces rugulosus]|uniref:Stress-response A/B barrel domain-containing protein n=1 Tax=Talaromyces rugulosus TaxID=121627 RepID=A0A7H8QUJ6_TALRU|nr:uncharacterized protein TRUGW13939_04800 [Talaromyces rugulosus]QKX57682.1 hypothetical protein TRUGW13939_04800 [Talaromyces rugulosus]